MNQEFMANKTAITTHKRTLREVNYTVIEIGNFVLKALKNVTTAPIFLIGEDRYSIVEWNW